MWISILFVILILAVAFFQATQGFFSALIMTGLTVCCAAAAVGTYEWVAINWLAPLWRPDFSLGISLTLVFVVPLIVLRIVFDKLIRRSSLLPLLVDRIGGGFCGFITAMLVVGVSAHAIQLLPFGPSILGFERVRVAVRPQKAVGGETPPEAPGTERELWLQPDRFAIATVSVLSAGLFNADQSIADVHPDLVQASGWVASAHPEVSRLAKPGSISMVGTEIIPFVYELKPPEPRSPDPPRYDSVPPGPDREFRMIRIRLDQGARDTRKSHVFTLRQIRLMGVEPGTGLYEQYTPIAIQQEDAQQPINRHIRSVAGPGGNWPVVDEMYSPREGNNDEIEVVFDLPKGFRPVLLEYKRGARVAVSFEEPPQVNPRRGAEPTGQGGPPTSDAGSPDGRSAESASSEPRPRRRSGVEETPATGGGGRVRGAATRAGLSFFGDELPLPVRDHQPVKAPELVRGRLAKGHFIAEVDKQEGSAGAPISRFAVPSDKRLLHLNVTRLHVRSGLGRAIDFAASTVQNYVVVDENGNRYSLAGKYALATLDGKRVLELEYFDEQVGSIGGLGPFTRIKDDHLKEGADYDLVLLFLVDPGVRITSFSTGSTATRQEDLTDQNLVAPS